jgi:tetratricopeptide (TPR) repeat protein
MQEKQQAQFGFVQSSLPWFVAAGAFLVYLLTLNHWVTLGSLPYVAKVTGWDLTPPLQAPLFFTLTFPVRLFPSQWQPILLNVFAALCSAVTLALLARSVALLPHDRTHAQRQRERSEFSFLSIPSAWLPPLFAVLVCGLQLSFWEHSTAATSESLDLLLFAYVIRCLLEYRISHRETWLMRMAFVYGLGITNNWAMIGFLPCFLIALVWIKGTSFFRLRLIGRLAAFGAAGLLLYLLLPLVWTLSDSGVDFWQSFRAQLANQKAFLFDTPVLRNRIMVLSMTSILPILIIGFRWPTSFGDTSAAGAALTNVMFRVIHIALLAACLWVFFDQKFSPRGLVTSGFGLPLLTFYYLGALSVGYFSGYLLLVFGESKTKTWKRKSQSVFLLERVILGAVWLLLIAVPTGLVYKNLKSIRDGNSPVLSQLAENAAQSLPSAGAVVLSDQPVDLLLLEAFFSRKGTPHNHVFVHSRSLAIPNYHRQLIKHFPQRWPNLLEGQPEGEIIDDHTLLDWVVDLGRTNQLYYMHPSFGFYFERYYPQPQGLIYQLVPYPTNVVIPPPLGAGQVATNLAFWNGLSAQLASVQDLIKRDSPDAHYVAKYYSRALNYFGAALQREQNLEDATHRFRLAGELNTNNIPALVNLEYNKTLRTGESRTNEISKIIEDKFGLYRNWETILVENGPFDHPEFCYRLAEIFLQQSLFHQAAAQFSRVSAFETNNLDVRMALANVYLQGKLPDKVIEAVSEIRTKKPAVPLSVDDELKLTRLEAAAHFSKKDLDSAKRVLLGAKEKYPNDPSVLEALVVFYNRTLDFTNGLATIERQLQIDPKNAQALINQATIYYNTKDYARSIETLDRVLAADPKSLRALLYKVFMSIDSREYKQALTQVEHVLEIDPDNPEALLYKAVIQIESKSYPEAIEPLDRLLKLQPANPNALRNRAIAHLKLGKLKEAKKDYEMLLRQMPKSYIAYFGLGEIAYRQKKTADAIKYYELYLKYVALHLEYVPTDNSQELADEKKMVDDRLKELKAVRS